MKLIPDKYDDNHNVIRPGAAFIGSRTDNLKYIDKDGCEAELVPISRYYASTEILRGQPISIAQKVDLDEEKATDEFAYVKITDPDIDDTCIGLALNYAEPGQVVQVQRYGKFSYLTTSSSKYQAQLETGLKEVFVIAENGFLFDSVRGQKLFIAKQSTNDFDSGHTPKSGITIKDTKASITYDYIDNVYNTKNTIQIGSLTDAPITSDLQDQVVTIELDITGDTRGPIDNTQFLLTLGEDIEFVEGDREADLTEPHNNEGIYNEVKVIALADRDPSPAQFTITPKLIYLNNISENNFISVRKLGGKSVIIPFTEISFNELCNRQVGASDRGYLSLIKSGYHSDQSEPLLTTPLTLDPTNYVEAIKDKVIEALRLLDGETFENVIISQADKSLDTNTTLKEYQIKAGLSGGYFDIYQSEGLLNLCNINTVCHGSSAERGTAILADIRDESRLNVIGVAVSNQPGVHKIGDTIKVMKFGRFLTTGKLKTGANYYLGLNGRLTTKPSVWNNCSTKIGIAENSRNLLVSIQETTQLANGNIPMGYIKECVGGVPERGFLVADGATTYFKSAYEEFYNYLLNTYSEAELAVHVLDASNLATNEIDESKFLIPKITMNNGLYLAQIKYTTGGLYSDVPRLPFIRKSGIIENSIIEPINISKLVQYGTLEQSKVAPTLENIDVRFFIRDPNGKVVSPEDGYADEYVWRELRPGYFTYNNDTVYGFEWVVKQNDYVNPDGLYILEMIINRGLGPCLISYQGQPIPLNGVEYKVTVAGKNLWNREFSLYDSSEVLNTLNVSSDDLPPSVNAVKDYYENRLDTENLNVGSGQLESNASKTKIKNLEVDDISVKDKNIVYYEDLNYNKHLNTKADEVENSFDEFNQPITVKGVHGIYNKGALGNIDAKTIVGLKVSNGSNNITQNLNNTNSFIPYVDAEADSSLGTTINAGTEYNAKLTSGETLFSKKGFYGPSDNKFVDSLDIHASNINEVTKSLTFADTSITENIKPVNNDNLDITLDANGKKIKVKGIDKLEVEDLVVGTTNLNDFIANNGNSASSISFKTVKNEKIDPSIKNSLDTTLIPNSPTDAKGFATTNLDTTTISNELEYGSVKLGSALQALYEMPLSLFEYNYGNNSYKEQLGILVERINQIRDFLKEANEEDLAKFAHKKSTIVASDKTSITDANLGISTLYNGDIENSIRVNHNDYIYTQEEAASIAAYLDLTTNKKELAQELRSTVAILMAAAQETQERLLNVETSVFGFDSDTIPGNKDEAIKNAIDESLRESLNNSPLFLGLNRLIRAICLEIFDTTDLEQISSEVKSNFADSDTLKTKATLITRLDSIDEMLSDIISNMSGPINVENYNRDNVYNRLYEPLKDSNGEINSLSIAPDGLTDDSINHLEINAVDNNLRNSQVDSSGTWVNLPSNSDYNNKTGFNESSINRLHSPNNEDCGLIKIPRVITETKTMIVDGVETQRDFQKIAYDPDTGLPIYDEKAVVFLDSKVERINKKLSEVTKTIYGEDSVLSNYPNRTEVLRRNLTNVIDTLYPNRDFNIEVLDGNTRLFKPYEASTNINNGKKNALGVIAANGMDDGGAQYTSIITPLIKSLYSFESTQRFLEGVLAKTNQPLKTGGKNTPSLSVGSNLKVINWDSSSLKPNDFITAKNQLDWIKSAIGIEDTLSNDYIYNTLFQELPTENLTKKASSVYTQYTNNLKFWDSGNSKSTSPSNNILTSTNVQAMLSRKANPLEHRLSMLEATLDDLANWVSRVNGVLDGSSGVLSDYTLVNSRFEKSNIPGQLNTLVKEVVISQNSHLVLPDDIVSRYIWPSESTTNHNDSIIKNIHRYFTITKINTGSSSDYSLTLKKNSLKGILDCSGIDYNSTTGVATITIKHVTTAPTSLARNTIYLKTTNVNNNNLNWFIPGQSNKVYPDANVKLDKSHLAILDSMTPMLQKVAQSTFDFTYPLDSIKIDNSLDLDWYQQKHPKFGPNEYNVDYGNWILIESANIATKTDINDNDTADIIQTISEAPLISGNMAGTPFCEWKLFSKDYTYETTLDPESVAGRSVEFWDASIKGSINDITPNSKNKIIKKASGAFELQLKNQKINKTSKLNIYTVSPLRKTKSRFEGAHYTLFFKSGNYFGTVDNWATGDKLTWGQFRGGKEGYNLTFTANGSTFQNISSYDDYYVATATRKYQNWSFTPYHYTLEVYKVYNTEVYDYYTWDGAVPEISENNDISSTIGALVALDTRMDITAKAYPPYNTVLATSTIDNIQLSNKVNDIKNVSGKYVVSFDISNGLSDLNFVTNAHNRKVSKLAFWKRVTLKRGEAIPEGAAGDAVPYYPYIELPDNLIALVNENYKLCVLGGPGPDNIEIYDTSGKLLGQIPKIKNQYDLKVIYSLMVGDVRERVIAKVGLESLPVYISFLPIINSSEWNYPNPSMFLNKSSEYKYFSNVFAVNLNEDSSVYRLFEVKNFEGSQDNISFNTLNAPETEYLETYYDADPKVMNGVGYTILKNKDVDDPDFNFYYLHDDISNTDLTYILNDQVRKYRFNLKDRTVVKLVDEYFGNYVDDDFHVDTSVSVDAYTLEPVIYLDVSIAIGTGDDQKIGEIIKADPNTLNLPCLATKFGEIIYENNNPILMDSLTKSRATKQDNYFKIYDRTLEAYVLIDDVNYQYKLTNSNVKVVLSFETGLEATYKAELDGYDVREFVEGAWYENEEGEQVQAPGYWVEKIIPKEDLIYTDTFNCKTKADYIVKYTGGSVTDKSNYILIDTKPGAPAW